MRPFLSRLFAGVEPAIATANPGEAARLAVLHAACFRRGWTEAEFERLLIERSVVAQRARTGGKLTGFIISRIARDEAEILSVAVARSHRGRGIAGRLLDIHLRTLAGLGVGTVFLEVDPDNAPARRLYARRSFQEAGQRQGYYPAQAGAARALILRRDLS